MQNRLILTLGLALSAVVAAKAQTNNAKTVPNEGFQRIETPAEAKRDARSTPMQARTAAAGQVITTASESTTTAPPPRSERHVIIKTKNLKTGVTTHEEVVRQADYDARQAAKQTLRHDAR